MVSRNARFLVEVLSIRQTHASLLEWMHEVIKEGLLSQRLRTEGAILVDITERGIGKYDTAQSHLTKIVPPHGG